MHHDHEHSQHHDHHGHGHHHGHDHHHTGSPLNLAVMLTVLFAVVELAGGLISGSLALLADAAHMASDIVALGLALMASRIARKPATSRMSYGYGRVKLFAAQINGLALWFLSGWIGLEAFDRLSAPHPVNGPVLFGVAVVGLLVNLVILKWLHGDDDLNTRAAYWHVLGDALGSVAAIVAGAVIMLTGWLTIDPILSFLVTGILIWGGWRLVRETTLEFMDSVPEGFHVAEVQAAMVEVDGVSGSHHVHLWKLPSGQVALSAHVVVETMDAWHTAMPSLIAMLHERGISHATLQPEIECPEGEC
ncbi:MAG TPA: cation diffusion facilitator family transporter [Mariprofundaceae bacterium]|nr:cation diffusion facilitator family transporter [Mariprofundaceae bacterium]